MNLTDLMGLRPGILAALCAATCLMRPGWAEELRNQLQNAGFEQDWIVSKVLAERRWGLTARAEAGYGESDGKIDHWEVPTAWRDDKTVRRGAYSVKLTAGRALSQSVRVAMRSPKGGNPASGNTDFQPLDPTDLAKLEPRLVRGGAWVSAQNLPEGKANIVVSAGNKTAETPLPAGTYDWRLVEAASPEPWPAAPAMALKIECQDGAVWVDDAFLAEIPLGRNLAVNGDLEKGEANGWPEGYGQPEAFWWFRFDYYSWTGWGHDGGYGCQLAERIDLVPGYRWRGHAEVDSLVSHSGQKSLRFVAYPGDNFGVLGPAIQIDGAKPFEIGAWVKADRIHQVELMAVDTDTNSYVLMDTDHFAGLEAAGVSAGSKGQGTYDWTYLRKLICPKTPLKQIRPMLAVRGFDGRIIEKNHVGTVWFDDLEVIQRGGGEPTPTPAPEPPAAVFRVLDLDLGDRLWGRNIARITLQAPEMPSLIVSLTVTSPKGHRQDVSAEAKFPKIGVSTVELPFQVTELCSNWREQYLVQLSIGPGEWSLKLRTAFGTPSSLLATRASHQCLFPNEKLLVAANVQVSKASLADVSRLLLRITDLEGRAVAETAVEQPTAKLPVIVPEADGLPHLNFANLITMVPDLSACKIRPWNEATRDYTVSLVLMGRDGATLAEAKGVQFGRITPFPPSPLKMKEIGKAGHGTRWEPQGKLSVNDEHFLLVDGEPFCPVYFGEYGDTFRPEEGVNVSRDQIQSLGLNPLSLAAEEKTKYGMTGNFGTGEWDLNGMLDLKPEAILAATDKLRADNPGKLVVGGYDLISHPGSRRADVAARIFPAYDIIGMEASFASYVPNLRVDYFPAMKGRKCAILLGFEHYYFVPFEELRYRAYLSVMRGAAGLGLIPSRMMMPRPETNNYLRGMNAECRALAPVFAAPPPKTLTTADAAGLFTWEKEFNGKRYLFAVRGEPFLTRGLFQWRNRKSREGVRPHTEPRSAGLSQHWAENAKPFAVAKGDTIVQELFIEGAAPKMIALQFRTRTNTDHTWEHRAYWGKADLERYRAEADYPADQKPPKPWPAWMVVENPPQSINAASERGAYYFEVLGGAACKATDGTPSLKRMGDVPETGKWVTVTISAAEIGLESQRTDGIGFAVDGGEVYWGQTALVSATGEKRPLVQGSLDPVSVDSGPWNVRFTVPVAGQIAVRVLFENAQPTVEGNSFQDQFPTPYRARVYEISPR